MPPKPKFTRDEIADAALRLISRKGPAALTAQALGHELGSSARPIFTVFRNMEEVHKEVRAAASRRFEQFAGKAGHEQLGTRTVLFALEEPHLFQLLFMEGGGPEEVFPGGSAGTPAGILQEEYGLTEKEAADLFRHTQIYTCGVSFLCATGKCRFSEEEVNELLRQDFTAMLSRIKSGVPA